MSGVCVRCGTALDRVETYGHGRHGDRPATLFRCPTCGAGGAVTRAHDGSISNVTGPAVDATWGPQP